jgi:hypothetical protein
LLDRSARRGQEWAVPRREEATMALDQAILVDFPAETKHNPQ